MIVIIKLITDFCLQVTVLMNNPPPPPTPLPFTNVIIIVPLPVFSTN